MKRHRVTVTSTITADSNGKCVWLENRANAIATLAQI